MTTNEIFNKVRMQYAEMLLSTEQVKNVLKDMPKGYCFGFLLSELVKHKAILRVDKGKYKFPSYPIHKDVLDSVYKTINKKQSEYFKKYYNKKKSKKVIEDSKIGDAIELLLSTGRYEIYEISIIKTKL